MPTVTNDILTNSPKGALLNQSSTDIPDGVDFVFIPAADGVRGGYINDPGSYSFPNFAQTVDNAYRKGVLAGALLTLRINGNDYPMNFPDPDNDRQFVGFTYALKGKVYAAWALAFVTDDSPAVTIAAITNFGNNLRERTGKRGFLVVSQAMFEGKQWNAAWSDEQHKDFAVKLQSEIGNAEYSKWSLLIIGQYNVPAGGKVYTPGNFSITNERNIIWEVQPRKYIMWGTKAYNAKFLGVEWPDTAPVIPPVIVPPVVEPPVVIPPDTTIDTTGQAELIAELKVVSEKIDGLLAMKEDVKTIADALRKLEA